MKSHTKYLTLTIPGKIEKMGYKGVDTTELVMDDLRLPASTILGGEPGRGFYQMMDGVEVGRVNVAARGCGIALRAFELAIGYAQQRHTFGKPIAQHQAIQFKLADIATELEAARWLTYRAASLRDTGQPFLKEAAMAKLKASEALAFIADEAIQIHGGMGLMSDLPLERIWRDARVERIWEGTSEIQRHIISRAMLRPLGG